MDWIKTISQIRDALRGREKHKEDIITVRYAKIADQKGYIFGCKMEHRGKPVYMGLGIRWSEPREALVARCFNDKGKDLGELAIHVPGKNWWRPIINEV